jgi:hypothetical protein
MAITEWVYPETWKVGDLLDEETLNRRVRDQNALLLRRPLLIASCSAPITLGVGDTPLTWTSVDVDDDGMCVTDVPATSFYVQRNGNYQIWLNITATGNGSACPTFRTGIVLNGIAPSSQSTRRWDVVSSGITTNGLNFCHSLTGMVFLSAGEFFSVALFQASGINLTLPAVNGTPRLAVMWAGVS